jgi:putative ABC transport system ATP-binding protein
MKVFQNLNDEGRTIIMITHETENIPYFKRIITFRDGLIVEDKEVMKRTILNGSAAIDYKKIPKEDEFSIPDEN